MTGNEHNRLVGIFLMAHGGLQGVMMLLMCIVYGVIGSAMLIGGKNGEEQTVGVVFIGVIALIAVISLIFIVPQIVGGYKLWKEKGNARTWGIVGSILSVMSFPIGTAVGVYGLWFLFGEEGKRFYLRGGQPMFQNPPQPPQPNSWQ